MKKCVIITCGKNKADSGCLARDLYTGSFFKEAKKWAESTGLPWFILGFKYGLIEPDQYMEPYEFPPPKKIPLQWYKDILQDLMNRGFDQAVYACKGIYVPPERPGIVWAFDQMKDRRMGFQKQWFQNNIGKCPSVNGVLQK